MIDEIDILHKNHRGDFANHFGEKSAGLLCVVPYHHEGVVKFGEYGLDSLAELSIGLRGRGQFF